MKIETASYNTIKKFKDGKFDGGKVLTLDITNDSVGIPTENPNLSAWEKIPAVLMGITFSLTGVVNAFKSAHNVSTFFNQSLMKAAGTVANYGGVVSAANTSM